MAAVWKCQPAVKCTCTYYSLRILKSYRPHKQDSVPSVNHNALCERFIALVKAYQAGTAVFMVEGLQLIIAVLLIILGLTIVLHSGKRLVSKETKKA